MATDTRVSATSEAAILGRLISPDNGDLRAEAAEALLAICFDSHALDRMRIRAFPFHSSVASFIADHDFVYVVEQNRDAQLRSLIVNENGIDPVRLVPIRHYDGTPITARFIANAIGEHQDQLKLTPLRKVKS